ncbi:MAG: phage terminase large subunit [Bacteroidales bacterium]|nr:phage terminase large subunit [Bacteroidales bacterium]
MSRLVAAYAKERFWCFMPYANPNYDPQWFHQHIANSCQRLYEGEIKKLMIFVPPQHGKSEIVSRCFPAWVLGKNPDTKIVGCSYSAVLVQQFSRSIQRTIDSEEYKRIFPDTYLNGSNLRTVVKGYLRNVDLFETVGHKGFYKAVGVGGSLTGTPVDIGIIDDPVKDAVEAYSTTYRERVWEWYTSVFLTRLHNESKQLLIMTRWHDDDLAGRLLEREGNTWDVVSIPALCEDKSNPNDPREIGEALWENRHSRERLLEVEKRSPQTFAALYQQRPTIQGGNIIKRDWFGHVSAAEFNRMYHGEPVVFFLDTAYTSNQANDPTGIIATCKIGGELYITHAEKVLMKFPDLIRHIPQYVKAHGYTTKSSIRIEPKANGLSVIDELKDKTGLNVTKTPSPKDDKETRLNVASPSIEAGRVVLVDGAWTEQFIDEVCGFPAKPHDEYVDVLAYAVDYHLANPYKPIDRAKIARRVY